MGFRNSASGGHASSNQGPSSNLPPLAVSRTGNPIRSISLQDFSSLYNRTNVNEDATAIDLTGDADETKPLVYQTQKDDSVYTPKALKSTHARLRCWIRAVGGGVLVCLLFFLFYLAHHWYELHWKPEKLHYSIVLDCGSTSTRIQVYSWTYKDSLGHGDLPVVTQPTFRPSSSLSFPGRKAGQRKQSRAYQRMESEPGLHKLVNNETGVRLSLETLLQWAQMQIPRSDCANTPVFLLATAGMRGLAHDDAQWLLDKAWGVIHKSPFMSRRDWVKVISGVEEAYYGWVALNYKFGRLGHTPQQKTFGALDLGGSSLQVTFESEEIGYKDYEVNLSLGHADHHLYAFSHSGFGLNDAFDRSVAVLWKHVQENDVSAVAESYELEHPCLNAGFRGEYKCSHCDSESSSANVPDTSVKSKSQLDMILVGKPDWESCKLLAHNVVNGSKLDHIGQSVDCFESACALGRHQPTPHGKFYALSGFFVVYKFFALQPDSSFLELLDRGKAFCERPWTEALDSVVPQPLVEHYCFRAPYVVDLLQNGLHLKEDQITVGSGDMTWTLGAALLEAGAFRSSEHIKPAAGFLSGSSSGFLTWDTGIISFFLLVVMVIIFFVVTYFQSCMSFLKGKPRSSTFFSQSALSNPRFPSLLLPIRCRIENTLRTGDGRSKTPHSPAPLGAAQDQHQLRFGSIATAKSTPELANLPPLLPPSYKGSSKLSSRRTQSRDDLIKYST